MKFLAGFLAFISSLYTGGDSQYNNSKSLAPLNTAIVSYSETYFAPAVAEPGNFPKAKAVTLVNQSGSENIKNPIEPKIVPEPVLPSPPPLPITIPPISISTPLPPPTIEYVLKTEPIIDWLGTNFSFMGTSFEGDRTLPELTFDREYWRMEIFAYWAPNIIPPKPVIEKDYVKIEVYEAGTSKLIHTITSEGEESIHKFQSFKMAGKYYFKIYSKSPSQWEIKFTVSSKIAQ
ncbi:MAG: hypothetical protein AAB958_01865 [Patescibacteria group bacterium]